MEFPFWLRCKESACNAGDPVLIPRSGREPGEKNGYPLHCSCLENSMDRGAWWAQSMGSQDLDIQLRYFKSQKMILWKCCTQYSSVQLLSRVWLFVTPWPAACQVSLTIAISWSLPKLMSIELVMPSNHLILCFPLLLLPSILPSFKVFSNESSGGQSTGVSASISVLPMNIQNWFPLGWTGWISLQSKGLSRVFFNTTVQKHQFFCAQLSIQSNSHIHTWPLGKP